MRKCREERGLGGSAESFMNSYPIKKAGLSSRGQSLLRIGAILCFRYSSTPAKMTGWVSGVWDTAETPQLLVEKRKKNLDPIFPA